LLRNPQRRRIARGRGVRTRPRAVALAFALLGLLAFAAAAGAEPAKRPWPPIPKDGLLFAHFGEEHWNDKDGAKLLPQVIRDTARYRPNLVTTSGDKSSDNAVANLSEWKRLMSDYDTKGIPYFAAVGNHDRARPGSQGIDPTGSLANYMQILADRPYPFGDAAPLSDPLFSPSARPASDPAGASSHYAFSYGNVRWVFLDNSCFGIATCDPFQSPTFPDSAGAGGQYDFLSREAAAANASGQLIFVVMHMPTQDPRPGHTMPTPLPHTMGEGGSPDNALFEQTAAQLGVDGVFLGHIKGQWTYTAGGVPYYTDGGAGGALYVGPGEQTGVDSGYWHGYRLISVQGNRVTTDTVPIFKPGGITVDGPGSLAPGASGQFSATGDQPTELGPPVTNLQLREPDPSRPNAANLPVPARIWRTSDLRILGPLAGTGEDPRRDPRRETVSGRFLARCPGRTGVRITSGWETQTFPVRVPSRKGRLIRSIRGGGTLIAGRREAVARVRLAQPARVLVRIRRRGKTVARLAYRCLDKRRRLTASWNGHRPGGGALAPGAYKVNVLVLSDRATISKRFALHVSARRPR